MNTVASRPSMVRIYALESWFAFVQVLRAPAFALPTLLFPLAFYVLFALVLPTRLGNMAPAHYMLASYGAFAALRVSWRDAVAFRRRHDGRGGG